MARFAKALRALLSVPLVFLSCSKTSLTVEDVVAFAVKREGETFLAVWVEPSGVEEGQSLQMEVLSPSSLSWTLEPLVAMTGDDTWYGSSSLLLPFQEEGEYQVHVMRSDGKRTECSFSLPSQKAGQSLDAFSFTGNDVSWEDGRSLSWRSYDREGAEVGEGVSDGKVSVQDNVKSISFCWYDEARKCAYVTLLHLD